MGQATRPDGSGDQRDDMMTCAPKSADGGWNPSPTTIVPPRSDEATSLSSRGTDFFFFFPFHGVMTEALGHLTATCRLFSYHQRCSRLVRTGHTTAPRRASLGAVSWDGGGATAGSPFHSMVNQDRHRVVLTAPWRLVCPGAMSGRNVRTLTPQTSPCSQKGRFGLFGLAEARPRGTDFKHGPGLGAHVETRTTGLSGWLVLVVRGETGKLPSTTAPQTTA